MFRSREYLIGYSCMGDIRYNEEGNEYESRTLTFRGPPYGRVTNFILARGWATSRRQAELRLLMLSGACVLLIGVLFLGRGDDAPIITPEQAAELEASR
jgi:hypothetical protein